MATALELATFTPQGIYAELDKLAGEVNTTMYALCDRAGVDYSTVQKWRSGSGDPSFRIVRKLLQAIEIIKGEIEAQTDEE